MVFDAERHKQLNSPFEHRAALIKGDQNRGEREQHPVHEHENPQVVQTPDVLPHTYHQTKHNAGAAREE